MRTITHTDIKKQLTNDLFGLELLTDLYARDKNSEFPSKIELLKRKIKLGEYMLNVVPITKNDKLIALREEFSSVTAGINNIRFIYGFFGPRQYLYARERESELGKIPELIKRQDELMKQIKELECT